MIYYRATSPYKGDVTKNSSLSGSEIDNNFLTLEGRDIKAVRIEGNDLVVYLMNGDAVRTTELMKDYAKNLSFDFDAKSGVLTINNNGQITTLKGFKSKDEGAPEIAPSIAVDETLRGSGSFDNPLSVALNSRPGQYKPAKAFIDLCKKGNHCMPHHPEVGDRYVVAQEINNYGFLYDYNAVTAIACQLRDTHSPWRIPTKADWDDMLNAVEPSPEFRTHAQPYTNHTLGRFAGDILKAPDAWGEKHCHCDNDARFSDELEEEREKHMHDFDHHHDHHDYHRDHDCDDHCHDKPYCGELGKYHHKHCHGIPAHCVHSKYGFDVLPVGYTDDCRHYINCCERAAFWTATNSKGNSAYMKRFDNHCGGVHQDMIAAEHALSLRLIKDYDGLNYHECEDILGVPHTTVIMPSESKGSAIWTSVNLGIGDRRLRPIVPDYHNDEYANWHKFYFVAEWDGRMWVRAAIKEGETITIINTPDGRYNKCYRMVEGQLVDESQIVLEEVRDAISEDIEVINKNINENALAIEENANKIAETNRELSELNGKHEALSGNFDTHVATFDEHVKAEAEFEGTTNEALKNLNNKIDKNLEDTNARIDKEVEDLNTKIDAEAQKASDALDAAKNELSELIGNVDNKHDDSLSEAVRQLEERIDNLATKTDEDIASLKEELETKIEKVRNLIPTKVSYKKNGTLVVTNENGDNRFETVISGYFGTLGE